jgi:hypothetical protein
MAAVPSIWDLIASGLPGASGAQTAPWFPQQSTPSQNPNDAMIGTTIRAGPYGLASRMAPQGIPWQDWRQSANVENNQNAMTPYSQLLTPQFWAGKLLKMQQGDNPVIYPGGENTPLAQRAGVGDIDQASRSYAIPKEEWQRDVDVQQAVVNSFTKYPPRTQAGKDALASAQEQLQAAKNKPWLFMQPPNQQPAPQQGLPPNGASFPQHFNISWRCCHSLPSSHSNVRSMIVSTMPRRARPRNPQARINQSTILASAVDIPTQQQQS